MALTLLVYTVLGATLAGTFMVVALTVGLGTAQPLIYAAIAGFVVAVPAAWLVAKKIRENT